MSLAHGKECAVLLNGRNASSFIKNVDIQAGAAEHDTTTLNAATVTRKGGLLNCKMALDGLYDGTATTALYAQARAILASSSVALLAVYVLGESAIGALGFAMRGRLADHKVDMPSKNLVTVAANFTGYKLLELIESLHPLAAETTTGNGTSFDNGAATTGGGAFHVHCTAHTGAAITLTIEDSADNSSFALIGTFSAISAAGTSERIEVAGTIRRYTRVVRAGAFTSSTFSVGQYRG